MAANLSNWRESPHNTWAFHNIDKVLSTQHVRKAEGDAPPLSSDVQTFKDFKVQLGESPEFDLASFQKATETDGMIVLHNGKIAHEFYDHENDATSKHILMSM